jgi:hypothetical protein
MNSTFGRVALWTGPTVVASTVEATADSMNSRRVTFGDMRAVYIRLVLHSRTALLLLKRLRSGAEGSTMIMEDGDESVG